MIFACKSEKQNNFKQKRKEYGFDRMEEMAYISTCKLALTMNEC